MAQKEKENKRNRNIFKNILKIIEYIILALILVMAIFFFITLLPISNNFKIYSVMSGSMDPALKVGSLVISKPQSQYQIGDIITYKSSSDQSNKDTTTHRIVGIEKDEFDVTRYITRGDANDANDINPIYQQRIIGREFISIPYVGYLTGYAKTLPGLLLIIIVPATIIIYEESKKIHKESKIILAKRRAQKSTTKNSSSKSDLSTEIKSNNDGGRHDSESKKDNQ